MADIIVDGTQFNVNNIKYSAPKANASGGKSVNILNKLTNTGLRLSTPLMLTWGAGDFVDESGKGNGKFEVSHQFPLDEDDKTEDTEAFLKNMKALETKIKADALTYSKEWFGKVHKSAEVIEALWTPMLKYSKDKVTGEYNLSKSPSVRYKLPQWEGVWKSEIYDEEEEKLFPNLENPSVTPVEFLKKGTQFAALIQCGGLWFANGKFGITWKVTQAVVQKPRAQLTGQCFIKLKKTDKDKLKKQPTVEEDVDDEIPTIRAEVEDSDEELEVEPLKSTSTTVVEQQHLSVVVEEEEPIKEAVKQEVVEVVEELKKKKVVKKKTVSSET